ncbi:MAG: hypothetical protein IM537_04570 [Pseudanabaena sp. M57BS1SP1A06MG]|nr:hypothetical protein [Pseudanabaena sp. M53BS1SP1A06MG]MCA6592279.1 hypothetical protein [Pseudanabaena sp. M38BS1SP1A06MG]MCA6599490.1 hypothetical protein [Pseudanabaena sp. M57BS1SP1A06MG]
MKIHKKTVFFSLLSSFFLLVDNSFAESPLLIYGSLENGTRGIVFLGCINCNKFDDNSLSNRFGDFGSRFSETSIYNRFGNWGSKFSDVSACNPRATNPPVIVDKEGNFQGYLTLNRRINGIVIDPRIIGACQ